MLILVKRLQKNKTGKLYFAFMQISAVSFSFSKVTRIWLVCVLNNSHKTFFKIPSKVSIIKKSDKQVQVLCSDLFLLKEWLSFFMSSISKVKRKKILMVSLIK